MRPLRVLVVDDHKMFAEAITSRLNLAEDIDVVGVETRGAAVIEAVHRLRPDIVTMDLGLGDADGIDVATEVRRVYPSVHVVMLTCFDDLPSLLRAVSAGISAWVPKDSGSATLLHVLRGVARGDGWLPPRLLGALLREVAVSGSLLLQGDPRLRGLTARETDVLQCLMAGLDRSSIAQLLGLSVNTVRTHQQHVFEKLNVHSALEATAVALMAGLRPWNATEPATPMPTQPSSRSGAAIGVGGLVQRMDRAAATRP